jgi:hypothetical protein
VEVARKRRALVRDLDRLDRRIEECGAGFVAVHASPVGVGDARIPRVPVEVELGRAIVVGGAQISVARANLVPAAKLVVGLARDPVGQGVPGSVPAVIVPWLDPSGDGERFADLAAAIFVRGDDAQRLKPEVWIVGE